MKVKDENKEAPKAVIPMMKMFEFPEDTTPEKMEEEINEWVKIKTFQGNNPMPGKAFSNHKTGKVYVMYIYALQIEVPKEYAK